MAPGGPAVVGGGAMCVVHVWPQFSKQGVSLETLGKLKFILDDLYDGKLDRQMSDMVTLEDLFNSASHVVERCAAVVLVVDFSGSIIGWVVLC